MYRSENSWVLFLLASMPGWIKDSRFEPDCLVIVTSLAENVYRSPLARCLVSMKTTASHPYWIISPKILRPPTRPCQIQTAQSMVLQSTLPPSTLYPSIFLYACVIYIWLYARTAISSISGDCSTPCSSKVLGWHWRTVLFSGVSPSSLLPMTLSIRNTGTMLDMPMATLVVTQPAEDEDTRPFHAKRSWLSIHPAAGKVTDVHIGISALIILQRFFKPRGSMIEMSSKE